MTDGSVIIDMAASNGGNCALTEPGQTVVREGVTIHGPLNLPAEMPVHASQMYARTIQTAIGELVDEGALKMDMEDEIVAGCCCTHEGAVIHPRITPLTRGRGARRRLIHFSYPCLGAPHARLGSAADHLCAGVFRRRRSDQQGSRHLCTPR